MHIEEQPDFTWPSHSHAGTFQVTDGDPFEQAVRMQRRVMSLFQQWQEASAQLKDFITEHKLSKGKIKEQVSQMDRIFKERQERAGAVADALNVSLHTS